MCALYCHAVRQSARIKYVEAIRKTKGGVARRCADCRLAILGAVGVSQIEPSRNTLVPFVISKRTTGAKLVCCWQPCQGAATGKIPIKLNRRYVQVAVVISDHPPVLKLWKQHPLGKHTLREGGPEKFDRHEAIIGLPIRVRALQRYCARISVPAHSDGRVFIEAVIQGAAYGHLIRVLHRPKERR